MNESKVTIHLHVQNHLQEAVEGSMDLRRVRGGVSQVTGDIIEVKSTGERPSWWSSSDHDGHYTVSPNMIKHQTMLTFIRDCDFVEIHK